MAQKKHIIPRVLGIAFAGLLILAALVYFAGVKYFQTHFPFHTTFLGYDLSEQTADAVGTCMEQETDARTLTLLGKDGQTESILLSSAVDYQRSVAEPSGGWIDPDDSWFWPQSLFRSTDLSRSVLISYDPDKLAAVLDASSFMDKALVTAPKNAYLEWRDGVLELIPEIEGNELYRSRTLQKMQVSVETDIDTLDLVAEGCYREPSVRSDDRELNRTLERYRVINFQQIEIDLTDVNVTLTPDDVLDLYLINAAQTRYLLQEDDVAALVAQLKEEYDTYERSRPFVNHYGNEISVGTGADTYGFRMDADATTELLIETLESKQSVTIEPVWVNSGWARQENGSDIGGTYIEVSISNQCLWAYVDGEQVMSTNVVTGNAGNHDTPRGVFRILNKARNTVLVGDDYESPVSYWMPLTWRGVGLHDASWRGSFGGSIYTYNGSHGCINMPEWAASQLYNTFGAGTPVVVW